MLKCKTHPRILLVLSATPFLQEPRNTVKLQTPFSRMCPTKFSLIILVTKYYLNFRKNAASMLITDQTPFGVERCCCEVFPPAFDSQL